MVPRIILFYCLSLLIISPVPARNAANGTSTEPLRAKIIRQTGTVQIWSKITESLDTLKNSGDIVSSRTLIIPDTAFLHLTFEPLVELMVTGPATLGLDNLMIDRSCGTIRMLLSLEKGSISLKAPPQTGHILLLSLKTPSALLDASVIQANVTVDSTGKTTSDILRGYAKILSGNKGSRTTVVKGQRCITYPDKTRMQIAFLPEATPVSSSNIPEKSQPTIGILSIRSAKPRDENLEPVSNRIASEFEKNSNAKILYLDDIRKLLHNEGNERLLSCYTDSCISEIGSKAGVDVVIVGNMNQLGSSHILDLKMIDVLRDKLLNRTSISVKDDIGLILNEIPAAISKLSVVDTMLSSVIKPPVAKDSAQNQKQYQETVVWIFPGKFTMGSQFKTGDIDELPTHTVELDGFYIDRFEVTRGEFENVMGFNPVPARGCSSCPVTNVTWQEASDYCRKVGKRLPTEAEWEYACRAGTNSPFYTGVTLTAEDANFNGQKPFGGSPAGKFAGKTVPVGDYPPNNWNLHDMYGNAAEWCSDWYDVAYYGNSPAKNPQGPEKGTLRVVRGGSWNSAGADVRSANRMAYNPELRLNTTGFRCVKSDDSKTKK